MTYIFFFCYIQVYDASGDDLIGGDDEDNGLGSGSEEIDSTTVPTKPTDDDNDNFDFDDKGKCYVQCVDHSSSH